MHGYPDNMFLPKKITRRQALTGLAGTAGVLIFAGCGSNATTPAATTSTTAPLGGYGLGARFPDGSNSPTVLAAGSKQRAPYVLLNTDGWPATEEVPDSIELTIRHDGAVLGPITVNRHGEAGATPYYPLSFTPPTTGTYTVTLDSSGATHALEVVDAADLSLVLIGDQLPAIETPTTTDAQGIDPICSRFEEPCPFHEITVTEALNLEGPTALLVSTPGFCQSDVCGPALEVLITAAAQRTENWSVIHTEVYTEPNAGNYDIAPVIDALGLPFEPSLYVANAQGTVTEVVHLAMDYQEVAAALATAV